MKNTKVLPYPCRCGGKLIETPMHIEYFGIDFGIRTGHVCTSCGDEFITDEIWEEVENKAKELGIFGIEKKVKIRKSGNSLVVTIPPDIAKYLGIKKEMLVSLLPTGKRKMEINIVS